MMAFSRNFYNDYVSCLEDKQVQGLEPWQDLQNFIKTGYVSPAFEEVTEKFSCKRVLEIEEALRLECDKILNIVIESIYPNIEISMVILDFLSGSQDCAFKEFKQSLSESSFLELETLIRDFMEKSQEFLFLVTEIRDRYTNFFSWLYKFLYKKKHSDE